MQLFPVKLNCFFLALIMLCSIMPCNAASSSSVGKFAQIKTWCIEHPKTIIFGTLGTVGAITLIAFFVLHGRDVRQPVIQPTLSGSTDSTDAEQKTAPIISSEKDLEPFIKTNDDSPEKILEKIKKLSDVKIDPNLPEAQRQELATALRNRVLHNLSMHFQLDEKLFQNADDELALQETLQKLAKTPMFQEQHLQDFIKSYEKRSKERFAYTALKEQKNDMPALENYAQFLDKNPQFSPEEHLASLVAFKSYSAATEALSQCMYLKGNTELDSQERGDKIQQLNSQVNHLEQLVSKTNRTAPAQTNEALNRLKQAKDLLVTESRRDLKVEKLINDAKAKMESERRKTEFMLQLTAASDVLDQEISGVLGDKGNQLTSNFIKFNDTTGKLVSELEQEYTGQNRPAEKKRLYEKLQAQLNKSKNMAAQPATTEA